MKPKKPIGDRYIRQLMLDGFGWEAQQKLAKSRILVAGAGGLGCPSLLYLAAAGVGTIGIVDFDLVQGSNLHRQILFTEEDIGKPKVEQAIRHLQERNSEVEFIPYQQMLSPDNCFDLLGSFDIVLDGTDNFSTRYLLNDACYLLRKPLVMGAISQFEGQVSLFRNKIDTDVNYRDLFPNPPRTDQIRNCAEAGVLGVLPGLIGMQMANEAIKFIAGIGAPLVNRLFTYNALSNQSDIFELSANPDSRRGIPADRAALEKTDYVVLCGEGIAGQNPGEGGKGDKADKADRGDRADGGDKAGGRARQKIESAGPEKADDFIDIEPPELEKLLQKLNTGVPKGTKTNRTDQPVTLLDVREWGEEPEPKGFEYIQVPMSELTTRWEEIPEGDLVIFCQSGIRSKHAARLLNGLRGDTDTTIYNLSGGILNWLRYQNTENGS
ncbi:MAG TPA: HesA/MoeB/ThiF family protein [Flavihumibacter sp.]